MINIKYLNILSAHSAEKGSSTHNNTPQYIFIATI